MFVSINMRSRGTGSRDGRLMFEQAALPHLDSVYTAALRLTRNPDDAKDLLQDTILRAYRFFHQFTPGTNCRAWLLTILYNNFRNLHRRTLREQITSTASDSEEIESNGFANPETYDPETLIAGRMLGRQLKSALDSLPDEFREVLLLVDVQELNYREVAGVLDIPIGTVKSRVSRGRAMMREALGQIAGLQPKTGT
jgi:RNA polymerase sigma-70 factor (ECF subfamily)